MAARSVTRTLSTFTFYLGNKTTFPSRLRFRYLSSAAGAQSDTVSARISFDKNGAALLTIPTNNGELRRFVVNNDSATTLSALVENIKREGIANDNIEFQSATDGVSLAQQSSLAWQILSSQPTQLLLNGKTLKVEVDGQPPAASGVAVESLVKVESDLAKRAEALRVELKPLDAKVQEMLASSQRRTRVMTWVGLAYMSTQFGFLARLTWWDYSWDIVEPITYFVTYGTGIFFYAYYVLTKQEANFAAVFDRECLITVHKRLTKAKFDLAKYNKLRDELHEVDSQLASIRRSVDWLVIKKPSSQ